MNLAAEFAAGFSEGAEPMATAYTLNGESRKGVIRGTGGIADQMEPGMAEQEGIVIMEAVGNFTVPPDPAASLIVEVLEGQLAGKWVVEGCQPDNANFVITCKASE